MSISNDLEQKLLIKKSIEKKVFSPNNLYPAVGIQKTQLGVPLLFNIKLNLHILRSNY